MKPSFLSFFSFIALILGSSQAFAAACCGGGFAAPLVIVGDEKAQFTTSYSYSRISDDVGADRFWRSRDDFVETFKVDGSHVFADRFQAGASVPVLRRKNEFGAGDAAVSLGYEYLPEWEYSPWKPRGVGYIQLIAPTGKANTQTDSPLGRGFWGVSVGTVLTKVIRRYDLIATLEAHRAFARDYSNDLSSGTLKPGFGGTVSVGAGYNWAKWRVGTSVSSTYEDPVSVEGTVSSNGVLQRFATAALSASYMPSDNVSVTGTIADQTLLGSPVNTSLGQSVGVFLQRRWPR